MKKVTLLLSVIASVLLMTSCLNSENYHAGSPLSYITSTSLGVTYAKTVDGFFMTSPEIQLEGEPGSFAYITYSWKESENTVREDGIYNATVTKISDPLEKSYLSLYGAPEAQETEPLLDNFQQVLYAASYFDYHWIFAYSYKMDDGVKKMLTFYCNPAEMTDSGVVVDVRLTDADGSIEKDQTDILTAVDFKNIHDYYVSGLSQGEMKNIEVYFRYYKKKSNGALELFKTQQYYTMPIVKE